MIRDAKIEDLPTIIEIYNTSIPGRMATADLELVTVDSRLEWFAAHTFDRRPLWVLEIDGKVKAWLSFRSFYGRDAYRHTAEIGVYVSPEYHRQHLGDRLLSKAIAATPNLDLKTLLAFIFAHNQPSLNLFKKHNFQQWGYLPKVADLNAIDAPMETRCERDLIILGWQV